MYMTDYSKMSDFEINKAVAIATGHNKLSSLGWQGSQGEDCSSVIVRGPQVIGAFDPCNNPADAWSIIVENKISIDHLGKEIWGAKAFVPNGEPRPRYAEKNPLRAAMNVFLMMNVSSKQCPIERTKVLSSKLKYAVTELTESVDRLTEPKKIKNPLRAAVRVFLRMKEAENV